MGRVDPGEALGADSRLDKDESASAAPKVSDALGEVLCVCVVGILPLLLAGLSSINRNDTASSLATSLFNPVAKGQFFLYSFSLFGSLLWIFISQAKIYSKIWLGIYSVALISPCIASMFFYGRNPNMNEELNHYIVVLRAIF